MGQADATIAHLVVVGHDVAALWHIDAHNSWELARNLTNCIDLVQTYELTHPTAPPYVGTFRCRRWPH